jgi:predicted DNA-binding transcriptional regulator AlpA
MGPLHPPRPDLAGDLLEGAEAIGAFMGLSPRAIYRLSTEVESRFRPPFFKLGNSTLCARKSAILQWIAEREAAHQSA